MCLVQQSTFAAKIVGRKSFYLVEGLVTKKKYIARVTKFSNV